MFKNLFKKTKLDYLEPISNEEKARISENKVIRLVYRADELDQVITLIKQNKYKVVSNDMYAFNNGGKAHTIALYHDSFDKFRKHWVIPTMVLSDTDGQITPLLDKDVTIDDIINARKAIDISSTYIEMARANKDQSEREVEQIKYNKQKLENEFFEMKKQISTLKSKRTKLNKEILELKKQKANLGLK